MLKHLPEKELKKLEDDFLFNKKKVAYNKSTLDRKTYNSTAAADITDANLNDRLGKFKDQLKNEYVYRIPLRYFRDIGKINFPVKIDFKIRCHLEADMKRLFVSKKKVTSIGTYGDSKNTYSKNI